MLLNAHRSGIDFSSVVTIGRQTNYLGAGNIEELEASGLSRFHERWSEVARAPFADQFLRTLGAQRVDSIDLSDYEGATILHDMNTPLPRELHEQYDVVLEAGSLEHIFNLPVALRNCMCLLKRGGSLFLGVPANNLFGHGFYQFSPDLFFRVLGPSNGFELNRMVLAEAWSHSVELGTRAKRYQVTDPEQTGKRALLVNKYPTFLMIHATKTGTVPESLTAYQSDYSALWRQASETQTAEQSAQPTGRGLARRLARFIHARLPHAPAMWLRSLHERRNLHSLKRRDLFRPLSGF
jgi:SAM-dependent methyltransferase